MGGVIQQLCIDPAACCQQAFHIRNVLGQLFRSKGLLTFPFAIRAVLGDVFLDFRGNGSGYENFRFGCRHPMDSSQFWLQAVLTFTTYITLKEVPQIMNHPQPYLSGYQSSPDTYHGSSSGGRPFVHISCQAGRNCSKGQWRCRRGA
ncbi:hypothetical protein D3C81_1589950 [compost metagenome]